MQLTKKMQGESLYANPHPRIEHLNMLNPRRHLRFLLSSPLQDITHTSLHRTSHPPPPTSIELRNLNRIRASLAQIGKIENRYG